MKIAVEQVDLRLENPFKLSYGATTMRQNVLVRLDDGHYSGVGEAAVVPYYGETPERVRVALTDPAVVAALDGDPLLLEDRLDALPPLGSASAHAALDMALHDLWGQHLGQPLHRLWGLNPARCPASSFTVAMSDDEDDYTRRLGVARHLAVIKLKLGGDDPQADLRRVALAREIVHGDLCVDANGGWDAPTALDLIPRLADLGVVFVEQPVARDAWDDWRALREGLPPDHPPLIADESVQAAGDLPRLAGLVDGINVKLAKCGGLRPARQMIALARVLGLRVLLGCMVESSVAVTAAAHLAPLADYADLDGNLLVTNDPACGVRSEAGRLALPDAPGLGVTLRADGAPC